MKVIYGIAKWKGLGSQPCLGKLKKCFRIEATPVALGGKRSLARLQSQAVQALGMLPATKTVAIAAVKRSPRVLPGKIS